MTKDETCGAIKIEQRKVADLVPFARNSRTHSDTQVAQIAASIKEFGWTNPILIDGSNSIIAGHGFQQCPVLAAELEECGFGLRALIAWVKSSAPISRGHYHHQHETCWYAVKDGGTGHWNGDRKQTTVWQIDKPQKSETGHSTQKPVECMKRPIENNSSPGQAVYEPFSGSGTTIIAGEMTGRAIHAIELNPAYVDVAVKRWQEFTGEKAIHEATGQTFDEIAANLPAEGRTAPEAEMMEAEAA